MGATEVQVGHHRLHNYHNYHFHHHHCYSHHQSSANFWGAVKDSVLNELFFFQKHYWSQHQERSRNAIIPKVSVRMELKCKQKLLKLNYTGNKIHLIVFKSEYKQMQCNDYHTNTRTYDD